MKKIYYISRSYPGYYDTGGGALMRKSQVELLRKNGYKVIVILPNYGSDSFQKKEGDIWLIPYKINERITYWLHKKGWIECYLDKWVKNAVTYLKDIVTEKDIVFATTGGEMGTLKLGSILKEKTGAKFIFNYHDPISNTSVNGIFAEENTKLNKDKIEEKYLKNTDYIITSSKKIKKSLLDKYKSLSANNIRVNYFGYIKKIEVDTKRKTGEKLTVVYGGTFAPLQQPELLIKAAQHIEGVEVVYIGNHKNYQPLQPYKDKCKLLPPMPYEDYVNYIKTKADVGFLSLANEYYGACVPSKLFEYINAELPMIGALPQGDAHTIINNKGYGFSCHFSDEKQLKFNIERMLEKDILNQCKERVKQDKEQWFMEEKIKEIINIIEA